MANNTDNLSGLEEISAIRSILMGQQIKEFESRFSALQNHLSATEAAYKEQLGQLEQQTELKFKELQHQINTRFDKLEQLLLKNTDNLHSRIDAVTKADKANLAHLLAEMSKRLLQ